jgi:hypothetical protein
MPVKGSHVRLDGQLSRCYRNFALGFTSDFRYNDL